MTINEYLKHAELAQAAYAELQSGTPDIDKLQINGKGMAPTQAATFASTYSVIDQYNDLSSGLSVTLFEDASGHQTVAIRGTNDLLDFLTDTIDIAFLGSSEIQPQYSALSTKVQQWRLNGQLHSGFTVTGHSLGGFLAQALAAEFDSDVSAAYTYNAPGFSIMPGVVTNYATQLLEFLEITDAAVPNDKIFNVKTLEGISATAGLGQMLGSIQVVSIEDQSPNLIANHKIEYLVDSLAVYNLFAQVDSTLTTDEVTGIIQASASNTDHTLESAVTALGELFVTGFTPRTSNHYDSNRDVLYVDIQSITAALGEHSGMTIVPLGVTDANGNVTTLLPYEIANHARTDIAYRYALANLNPFAVVGADYTNFNQNSELDLYDPATGQGLTNMYLADRAEMLALLIHGNINDTILINGNVQYVDKQEDVTLNVISAAQTVAFNGDEGGVLEGVRTSAGNRLYGGSGKDVLRGYSGADYLEGGAGADVLDGGSGNDILHGGSGRDTYMFGPNHGADTIIETREADGFKYGVINYVNNSEIRIAYGKFTQDANDPDTWHLPQGFTLTKSATWTLTTPGGTIDLGEDFISGDFGIELEDETANEPPVVLPGGDDLGNYLHDTSNTPIQLYGLDGKDMLIGSTGDDILNGGGGDDWIFGRNGTDIIDSGAGNDLITGIGGGSTVHGGEGDDILVANGSEWMAISNANSPITADVFWRDASSLWSQGFSSLGMSGNGYLEAYWWSGVQVGSFSGNSVLGDGWTYEFTINSVASEAKYYHPDHAPNGKSPATYWEHVIQPNLHSERVYLYGDGGNDLLIGNNGNDYLSGGEDADMLFGNAGDDVLIGDAGDDILAGGAGDDIIDGGDDDDQIWGESGSDIIFGGAGDDLIWGDSYSEQLSNLDGDDYIDGGAGNDQILGQGGNDILLGGEGDDLLVGGAGKDLLRGGAGNDILHGDDHPSDPLPDHLHGNDILDGGKGNDVLMGGGGNDTYIFRPGDGPLLDGVAESITDNEGENKVRFEDGIIRSGVQVFRSGDDMIIGYGAGDWLYIYEGIKGAVQTFTFADGETLDWLRLIGKNSFSAVQITTSAPGALLVGGASGDELTATGGNSTFSGGSGNDLLIGAGGNNTYLYNLGDGTDRIVDSGGQLDGQGNPMPNRIIFGPGITPDDITLALGSLVIKVGAEPDNAIHIENFDPDDVFGQRSIDLFEFYDGSVFTYEQLMALGFDIEGTHGNDILHGTSVNDRLNGGAGDDILFGGEGNDILDGGPGNDFLDGGPGNDVYRFGRGHGEDTISHKYSDYVTGKRDVIELGPDTSPEDVSMARDGDDLVLCINGTSDRLIVKSYLLDHPDSIRYQVEEIHFAQGTVWDVTMVKEMLSEEVNTPPHVSGPVSLGDMNEDGSLIITTGQLLASAHDVDGDTLAVANLSAGSGTLVDNGDGSWTYSPVADFNGAVEFTYEVSDGTESVATAAALEVLPVNDAPVVSGPVSLGRISADKTLLITTGQLLSHTGDVDGDMLSIINLAADSGTLLDNGNGTWSYQATSDYSGSVRFSYQVTDGSEEVTANAGLTVEALLNIIQGNNNNNLLWGTKADDLIIGAGGNDILMGGRGDDTYIFNPGDGRDTIFDSDLSFLWDWGQQKSGKDTIQFGDGIGREDVALFMENGSLKIQYGEQDRITVLNQSHSSGCIERIQLANGSYLTDADINQLLQEMSAYAVQEGIALGSVNDVRQHNELMTMVAGSWQAA